MVKCTFLSISTRVSVGPFSVEGWHQCIDFFSLELCQPSADLPVLPLSTVLLNLAMLHFPKIESSSVYLLSHIWVYMSSEWDGKMLIFGMRNQVFLCVGNGKQNGLLQWHLTFKPLLP